MDTLCIIFAFLTEGGGGHAHIHICIRGQGVNVVIQGYVEWGQGVNFHSEERFTRDPPSTKHKARESERTRSTSSERIIVNTLYQFMQLRRVLYTCFTQRMNFRTYLTMRITAPMISRATTKMTIPATIPTTMPMLLVVGSVCKRVVMVTGPLIRLDTTTICKQCIL